MKPITLIALLVFAVAPIAQAADFVPESRRTECGLGDPVFIVCAVAADSFIAHGQWPVSQEAFIAHAGKLAEPGDDISDITDFFRQFAKFETHTNGKNLIIRLRLKGEKKDTTILLKPGASLDDIVQSASSGSHRPVRKRS